MQQNDILVKLSQEGFIKKISETNSVYALESEDGLASSDSNDYDDENGEPIGVICFWSEKELAQTCVKNDWAKYQVVEVPLSEFIENWCLSINNDGLLVGTNFDQDMFGSEIEPLELILELIKELKLNKSTVKFLTFDNLADLEKQIIAANS